MTTRYQPPRQPTLSSTPPARPPVGSTTLVRDAGVPPVLTSRQACDAKTALARGLAEYCGTLEVAGAQGRPVRFARVFEAWPQAEEKIDMPAAVVLIPTPGTYDPKGLSQPIASVDRLGNPDGRYLACQSEMSVDLHLAVWADDPAMRSALTGMLEDAFAPVDWMAGFSLDLPFYCGARAIYELKTSSFDDSEENAARRNRIATFTLRGRVPVIRIASAIDFRPSAVVGVT